MTEDVESAQHLASLLEAHRQSDSFCLLQAGGAALEILEEVFNPSRQRPPVDDGEELLAALLVGLLLATLAFLALPCLLNQSIKGAGQFLPLPPSSAL